MLLFLSCHHRLGLFCLLFLVPAFGAGCAGNRPAMTSAALHQLVAQERPVRIVDVRSAAEFGRGHIPGAIHIPFYDVDERFGELGADKDVPVVVYCAHGPRAWWAAFVLRRNGFSQVFTLKGSFRAWQQDGFRSDM